jgi:arginyl-tRNA synthetase
MSNVIEDAKKEIANKLCVSVESIENPPENIKSDFAFPCFSLARCEKKNPVEIAKSLSEKIKPFGFVKEVKNFGPYVNFYLNWEKINAIILTDIIRTRNKYGSSTEGIGKTILIDYSAPNIAKPMSVGHLRSTIIGHSILRIYKNFGYRCIGDLHQGDWGTQFGKLICAYEKWGSKTDIEKDPINELLRLYVKFHKECENDLALEDMGRECFKKLENGNKDYTNLWKWFCNISLAEFDKIYSLLGVRFDLKLGESFYSERAKTLVRDAIAKGVAEKNEDDSVIINFPDGIPPLLIQKSDETSLYATRDLAAIKYREKRFNPEKIIYVVGSEQKLYFEQLFKAAKMLGFASEKYVHVDFGLIFFNEKKLSTRKGEVIYLRDVIDKSIKLSKEIMAEKEIPINNELAKKIGIGVIKYGDLSRDRVRSINFDWEQSLSFEGDTSPYIQYTHARACSIVRKSRMPTSCFDATLLKEEKEIAIVKKLAQFPGVVKNAARNYSPHYIANYVYELSCLFNDFYQTIKVIGVEADLEIARLALVKSVKIVIKNALYLIGIDAPKKM